MALEGEVREPRSGLLLQNFAYPTFFSLVCCMGFEGVIGLESSLIGVTSNDPPCSQEWVAWVATEGTISNGELSVASPTGYGFTREDPLRGEVEEAAELEIGTAAA